MQSCWKADPKARPTFSDLKKELKTVLNWDSTEEYDALYVNVEPLTPPSTPTV